MLTVRVRDQGPAALEGPPSDLDWAYHLLSFQVRRYDPAARRFTAVRLYMAQQHPTRGYSCPPGYAQILVDAGATAGVEVQVIDERERPNVWAEEEDTLRREPWSMREDQLAAIRAVLERPLASPGRGILRAPTGWGKGRAACAIPFLIGGSWLFLVHRNHLAEDIAKRWEELTGQRAGWVGDGRWEPADPADAGVSLTCCSLQTLARRLAERDERAVELLEDADGALLDECHVAPAETFLSVLRRLRAYYRIGLSGTPLDRGDQRSALALGWLGPVVHHVGTQATVEAGHLAQPEVRILPYEHPPTGYRPDTWVELYDEMVVRSDARNALVLAAMQAAEPPGIVFVRSLDHAARLLRAARKAGLSADLVDGHATLEQRRRALARLKRADLQWIIATKVFSEGVDVPDLRTVILAAGGKSTIDTLQQIGRVMRPAAGKERAVVYDVGDKGHPTLYRHSRMRIAAMKREGYPVTVVDPATLGAA